MSGLKRAAVLCVIRHGDHFLLLRREREPNRGLYVPVGGRGDAEKILFFSASSASPRGIGPART